MPLVFGLGIGTTSVGFVVIDHESEAAMRKIHRLGVRILPETRDPKGVPLNQERRQARLPRRQGELRRLLGDRWYAAGLLLSRNSPDWDRAMKRDHFDLRRRAFEGETLFPNEFGRAMRRLAQRHHFSGRDIEEVSYPADGASDDAEDRKSSSARDRTVQVLKREAVAIRRDSP